MVAVGMDASLFHAGHPATSMRPEGGVTAEPEGKDYSVERPTDCDCSPLLEDIPCWPCYRDGFKKPAVECEVDNG
jgi:hypothetical protein